MPKLPPPDIGGIIPAFYGDIIKVPYVMNKLVGVGEFQGFKLVVKTITNNRIIATLDSNKIENNIAYDHYVTERV